MVSTRLWLAALAGTTLFASCGVAPYPRTRTLGPTSPAAESAVPTPDATGPVAAEAAVLGPRAITPRPRQEMMPDIDQIHPRTHFNLGIGIGKQTNEVNTGNLATRVVTSSATAYRVRLQGEHYFENDFGIFGEVYFGSADDIDEDLGATSSSFDVNGFFIGAAYRAVMDDDFRLPVRFGPVIKMSEQENNALPDGAVERSSIGIRLQAEPEYIIFQNANSNGKVSELSTFAGFAAGAGPAEIEDNVDSEDAYAFSLDLELGARYRFASGFSLQGSFVYSKWHIGTTESYNNAAFFGIDDDFGGFMLTGGYRF